MSDPYGAAMEQLNYLCDELDALRVVLPTLDDEVLSKRPFEGEPTIKELFASIGALDGTVRATVVDGGVAAMGAAMDRPSRSDDSCPEPAPETNSLSVDELLGDLIEARRRLVALIEDRIKDFGGDNMEGVTVVLSYLHTIIYQDTEILRRIAERIHEIRPARA